jgi:lipid-binding SYLF domain-containing protein
MTLSHPNIGKRAFADFGLSKFFSGALFLIGCLCFLGGSAYADDRLEARQLVERSKLTFERFMAAGEMGAFRSLLKSAQGVFIAPQVLKGAFIFGASGGSGVFLARSGEGKWTGPAFYTLGEGSFGLQIGGEASEIVLLVMTQRGVTALLSDSVKLGVDIGVAVGPVGAGADASTANLSADIITFSKSKGLYGGISLEGAIVVTRGDWNSAYYGRSVKPTDILVRRSVSSPHAESLINAVAKAAARR